MDRPDALMYYLAFGCYLFGFIGYVLHTATSRELFGKIATVLMVIGIVPHTAAFFIRWVVQEHFPLANMYEYMGLMAWMVVAGLLYFSLRFRNRKIGVIVSPVVVMLLVTASLLPSDVNKQLMPALQSTWLIIHVTLAALGSGAFLVAFAASAVYLLSINPKNPAAAREEWRRQWINFILFWIGLPLLVSIVLSVLGWLPIQVHSIAEVRARGLGGSMFTAFAVGRGPDPVLLGRLAIGFGIGMVIAAILWPILYSRRKEKKQPLHIGSQFFIVLVLALLLSAIIVGFLKHGDYIHLTSQSYLKIFEFFGPTLVVSWVVTPLLYYFLIRLDGGWIGKLSLPRPLLEDFSYSAVAVGYPLYTVGALFAGAIWAEQAWGSWWGWDPKEVGALIIWLFYTGFLHARYNRRWKNERAAVLVVLGMVMVFISFFGNYFFGGLHSFEVT